VSGNDFLQYWFDDPHTDVALMYLESTGNPRKPPGSPAAPLR
jgi:acyl-CoA synthetase (NDP forming)